MTALSTQQSPTIVPSHFVMPTNNRIWSVDGKRHNSRTIDLDVLGNELVTLEQARDTVVAIERLQDPRDYQYQASQCAVTCDNNLFKMMPVLAAKDGTRLDRGSYYFDRHGYSQFTTQVLPSHGGNFIEQTVRLNPPSVVPEDQRLAVRAGYAKIASSCFMAHLSASNKTLQFRTVNKRIGTNEDGTPAVARFVRAVVSTSYAPYSNGEMLSQLLDELGNLSVYRLNLADSGMHFRLLDLRETDGVLDTQVQYPTINGWNSETGQRRTGIGSGTVRFICTNGMGDYATNAQYNWVHRGDPQRIRNGMADALVGIRTSQSSLIHEYNRALHTVIDDGYAWMENILNGLNGITKETRAKVRTAMDDETGSNPHTLAGVVDGMTLLAQSNDLSLWDAIELEQSAVRVMRRGLRQSDANNRLYAPVA